MIEAGFAQQKKCSPSCHTMAGRLSRTEALVTGLTTSCGISGTSGCRGRPSVDCLTTLDPSHFCEGIKKMVLVLFWSQSLGLIDHLGRVQGERHSTAVRLINSSRKTVHFLHRKQNTFSEAKGECCCFL